MLDLHRASAGSGKTYTLAKKYIWYLITISDNGAPRRLRTDAELADSAHHILAVTFTNKATNEMQLRIVDKLYELANSTPVTEICADGSSRIRKPDYMEDFVTDLGVSPQHIASVCAKALTLLLENYSDFKVSTIDSFFQLILRTFAYESDLNDTYQVELDSEFLSQVGVDGVLEGIDDNATDTTATYWIRRLMDRADSKWNIFSRQYDSKGYSAGDNPYRDLVQSVMRLENEEYKMLRGDMEKYFAAAPDMIRLYEDLSSRYETPVRDAFVKLRGEARRLLRVLPAEMLEAGSRTHVGMLVSRIRRVALAGKDAWSVEPDAKLADYINPDWLEQKKVAAALAAAGEGADAIRAGVEACADALMNWSDAWHDMDYQHWRLYALNLPYLALFGLVAAKRQEYLNETNSVELGETSMILYSVIKDSDAPFVYERLGTYLNHFLIDEFQDTSGLQWKLIRPLLIESMSRSNDNLIIGDAKQSIYRFRNADPSLITSVVPREFGSEVRSLGNRPEENTNHRSCLRVVQFNNSFFEYFVSALDRCAAASPVQRKLFGPLYSNVVQTPAKRAKEGYVRLTVSGDKQTDFNGYVLDSVTKLVCELCLRGYKQKDIAVLVSRNSEGEDVINAFTAYNKSRSEEEPEIRFVSEQSLKVVSSEAVRIVVGVLENASRGFRPVINSEEERKRKGVGNWHEMESGFKFFAMSRPDEPIARRLDAFIDQQPDMEAVTGLFDRLQSLSIPSIVEAVISEFVPDALRSSDAVYIAAFQDLVLEYCEGHPTDIASFLKWWERKSRSASISSPEDTDAVRVLTIHKSKGLEYDCVIVPFANWKMSDGTGFKKEWRWVRPTRVSHPEIPLPTFLPVETTPALEHTEHASLLYDYYDMVKMDNLNSAYVAFTRATCELYIFSSAKLSSASKKSGEFSDDIPVYAETGKYLWDFLRLVSQPNAGDISHLDQDAVKIADREASDMPYIATVGEPIADPVAWKRLKSSDADQGNESVVISSYMSSLPDDSRLRYRQGDLSEIIDADDLGEDEIADVDPRSEGNLKHAILERVGVPSDLSSAVRHLLFQGLLTPALAAKFEEELAGSLQRSTVRRWFDGSARVINERPILKAGHVSRRPDRILCYPDGHAEVVDYKFGKRDLTGRYRRQIGHYVRRLSETGMFSDVKGYIWYVNEDIIEMV